MSEKTCDMWLIIWFISLKRYLVVITESAYLFPFAVWEDFRFFFNNFRTQPNSLCCLNSSQHFTVKYPFKIWKGAVSVVHVLKDYNSYHPHGSGQAQCTSLDSYIKIHFSENSSCLPAWRELLCFISLYTAIDLIMHLMPRELGKCIPQG